MRLDGRMENGLKGTGREAGGPAGAASVTQAKQEDGLNGVEMKLERRGQLQNLFWSRIKKACQVIGSGRSVERRGKGRLPGS